MNDFNKQFEEYKHRMADLDRKLQISNYGIYIGIGIYVATLVAQLIISMYD